MVHPARSSGALPLALLLTALLWLAGCSSGPRSGDRAGPQPVLTGQSRFFEGALIVDARLGPFSLNDPGALNRRPPEPGEGEPIPVRNGSFGGRGEREAAGGFPRGPAEQGAFGEASDRAGARRGGGFAATGGFPRQTVQVTIRSAAESELVVRVVEVKSALGNFVPVPEHFTLAPGGAQTLEPMRASYPAAIDELELLVVLRLRGREETQVVKLNAAGANGR